MCDVKIREWVTPPGYTYRAECACGWVARWGQTSRAAAEADGDEHRAPVLRSPWWESAWIPGI